MLNNSFPFIIVIEWINFDKTNFDYEVGIIIDKISFISLDIADSIIINFTRFVDFHSMLQTPLY